MASGTVKSTLTYKEVTATTNANGRVEINNQAVEAILVSPNYCYLVRASYNSNSNLFYVKNAENNSSPASNIEVTIGFWEYR